MGGNRSLWELLKPYLDDFSRRFIQMHVVEHQRGVLVNGDAEGSFNIVEGGSVLDDVRRGVRRPHAAHLPGVGVVSIFPPVLLIYIRYNVSEMVWGWLCALSRTETFSVIQKKLPIEPLDRWSRVFSPSVPYLSFESDPIRHGHVSF